MFHVLQYPHIAPKGSDMLARAPTDLANQTTPMSIVFVAGGLTR